MSKTLTYPIQLTPAKEGGYYVTSPVLSIFTQGETQKEALENAREAILCHLEGLAEERQKQPALKVFMVSVSVPKRLAQ